MQIEFQKAMQQLVVNQTLNLKEISKFTAVDFRLGIQWFGASLGRSWLGLISHERRHLGNFWSFGHDSRRLALGHWAFTRFVLFAKRPCATDDLPDAGPCLGLQLGHCRSAPSFRSGYEVVAKQPRAWAGKKRHAAFSRCYVSTESVQLNGANSTPFIKRQNRQ